MFNFFPFLISYIFTIQLFFSWYCSSTVVSAALVRIFDEDVAELPLVATSGGNHGKVQDSYFNPDTPTFLNVLCFLGPNRGGLHVKVSLMGIYCFKTLLVFHELTLSVVSYGKY